MSGFPVSVTRGLEALLDERAARTPIRHAIAAVESVDGARCWAAARGEDGGAPVPAESPFFIASIDKLFNATIAFQLIERRRLDLERRVVEFLPAATVRGLHRFGGVDHSHRITVRHLLAHSSGLPDWLEEAPRGGRSVVERLLDEGDMEFSREAALDIVRERLPAHFPPQDSGARPVRVRYSDTNYLLLAAVLEAVTGRPLHALHDELLWRPLGLRHTWFAGRTPAVDPAPVPATLHAGGRPFALPRLLQSIGGMYSTAGDLLAFLRALVRNEIFADPHTFAAMQHPWNRFGVPRDRAALRAPGWPIEYGLGLMRFRLPRLFTPLRPVPAVIGHTGSTGCWLFWCPALDVVLAGSVDEITAGALPFRLVPRMLRVLQAMD